MQKNATSCADHRKSRHREKGRQATGPLWLHLAAQAAERETLQSTDWIHISKKKRKRFHMNVWIMNIFAWGFFHCVFFFVTSQASFAKCCQLAGQKPGRPVWFGPTTRGANSLCFNAVYRMHPVGTGLGCEHQNINLSVFFWTLGFVHEDREDCWKLEESFHFSGAFLLWLWFARSWNSSARCATRITSSTCGYLVRPQWAFHTFSMNWQNRRQSKMS